MTKQPNTDVSRERNSLIHRLSKAASQAAQPLAAKLDRCIRSRPCRSGACIDCGFTFQAAMADTVARVLCEPAREVRGRLHAVTIVPACGCVSPEDLSAEIFLTVRSEIVSALVACDWPPSIGRVEASFNEDMTGRTKPHWCVHAHLIGIDWLSPVQASALRVSFPASERVQRPVHIEKLDGDIQGRRYPFKPERQRRVTVWSDDRERNRHRTTKSRLLRASQATALALVDDELGFHRQLLTHGIDDDAFYRHLDDLGWPSDSS